VAYVARAGNQQFAVIDGKEEKGYSAIGAIIFSPDSRRVAYTARSDDQWFVAVDGKEEKRYDAILEGTFLFSPDSKHAAYVAQGGIERFVVVNGKEGRRYDDIGCVKERKGICFDSFDSLRYVSRKGNRIYSAEIRNIGTNP
jgi:hypothetical protein